MLKVDQYSYIRTAHRVYGKKIKQIARETRQSKNAIKKGLRGEYALCRDPNYETFTTGVSVEQRDLELVLERFGDAIYRIKGQVLRSGKLQRVEFASGQLEAAPGSPEGPRELVWIVRGGEAAAIRQALGA